MTSVSPTRLDLNAKDMAVWRATRAESGYLPSVVRPR